MKHVSFVLALPCLAALTLLNGCAVFGVATRTDLEEMQRESDARQERLRNENAQLRSRVESLGAALATTERSLAAAESSLRTFQDQSDARRQEIWSKTGDLQVRLVALEENIQSAGSLSDSLREDLGLARRVAEAASSEALIVRRDLDGVSERARLAQARSDALLQDWLRMLREQRDRLSEQLTALEASLERWEAAAAESEPLLPPPAAGEDISANVAGPSIP